MDTVYFIKRKIPVGVCYRHRSKLYMCRRLNIIPNLPTSTVCNPQYWKLLLKILSDKAPSNVRPLKTWLSPLLHRISIQPILSSILEKYHEIDSSEELIVYVSSCTSIMWPISVQKMSLENLTDLLGLLLRKGNEGELGPGIIDIGFLVTSSYRASLGNSVNKKKVFSLSNFLDVVGLIWLNSFTNSSSKPSSPTGSVSLPKIPLHLRSYHRHTPTSCKIFMKLVQTHFSIWIFFATLAGIARWTSQRPSLTTSTRRTQKPPTHCWSCRGCSYLMSKY